MPRLRRRPAADTADPRRPALVPTIAPPFKDGRIVVGQIAVVITVVGWLAFLAVTISRTSLTGAPDKPALDLATIAYLVLMSLLACSALAYLITRLGFYYRVRSHTRAPRGTIGLSLERSAPTMTVLVPAYQEDPRVIRMTLLSAALQEYPDLEIVLLVDDPPNPKYAGPAELLRAAMRLPGEIQDVLAEPATRFASALERFEARCEQGDLPRRADIEALAAEYDQAVTWLDTYADDYEITDHSDRFLADQVLRRLAADLETVARALRAAADDGATLTASHLLHLHRRLDWIFSARLSSFERKRYVSLSHAANKAMNLNSYIGLMGGSYRDVSTDAGRALIPVAHGADLVVRDPDYVLTLDADSVLLPEYCLRIVNLLEQSEHARVAVAQTPYSAFPGPETRLERIAGATTDLQHILHQGMTYYDATFWVGANAILRKRALDELAVTEHVGDFEIKRYISDRTVIEDTESSIDLGVHGWRLLNYPERLSYSATPPDFGSLCIQRQRWANGGLLILPRLRHQIRARRVRGESTSMGELLLRVNYMASIAWASVALLFLLGYQFSDALLSPLIFAISVPYFLMMASDLRYCGYRRSDVLGIYGFNLVLLPVNLAGVLSSLFQGLTGARIAFRRTPKVRARTTPGLLFVVLPYVFVVFSVLTFLVAYDHERWVSAGVAAVNAVLAAYAIVAFIGLWHSVVDVWHNVTGWLYVPATAPAAPAAEPATAGVDWRALLQYGDFGAPEHEPERISTGRFRREQVPQLGVVPEEN